VDKILYKNIIATVTYYDVLDYPLTSFAVWKHLIRYDGDQSDDTWSLPKVISALNDPVIKQYIDQKNGMYFLRGRNYLVNLRREREFISIEKMRKLQHIVSILRISPFVRMICVTGRLSYYNCDDKSDLDVLVVYKYGHIWTGRFLITILTHLLGVRRYNEKIKDRVCLNYHITTRSLQIQTKDLFSAHEYSFIIPLFDTNFFHQFCRENSWIQKMKPHYNCDDPSHSLTMYDNRITLWVRGFFEMIFGDKGMEKRLQKIQYEKIKSNPKTARGGALIICNDENLVFLPQPHGPRIFEEYKKRFEALELNF